MSKQLYDEALADVKQIIEVAESNAKRDIVEALAPRVRELVEKELLRLDEDFDQDTDEDFGAPGSVEPEGDLMTDAAPDFTDSIGSTDAISLPDEEGKVTLDLDALQADDAGVEVPISDISSFEPGDNDEYELSLESASLLTPMMKTKKTKTISEKVDDLKNKIKINNFKIEAFKSTGRLVRNSTEFQLQINKMISEVENTYDYVQASIGDSSHKTLLENKLETQYRELNKLQETMMSKKTKRMMNEEDVTLKMTGLPDDIDLDSVGVDLIAGDDDSDDSFDSDSVDSDMSDGDEDLGDLDSGDESSEDSDDSDDLDVDMSDEVEESQKMSDDTVVEIDENMLRREISRMRKLREDAKAWASNSGVESSVLDNFGNASDEGEPLDVDVVTESDEEDLDEDDKPSWHSQDPTEDDADSALDAARTYAKNPRNESMKRRLAFESRLQKRSLARGRSLKTAISEARAQRNGRRVESLKREYSTVARRFNESVVRVSKISKLMTESRKQLQNRSRHNGAVTRQAESRAVATLREKLVETNLINAKLTYTNKLLQNESITARQKLRIIDQLDSARTIREAKLVYESLSKTLSSPRKRVTESTERKVLGSSSKPTRTASSQSINESHESERWAKLAGLTK